MNSLPSADSEWSILVTVLSTFLYSTKAQEPTRCDVTGTKTPLVHEQPTRNLGVNWDFYVVDKGHRDGYVQEIATLPGDDYRLKVEDSYRGQGLNLYADDYARQFVFEVKSFLNGQKSISTLWLIPDDRTWCHLPFTWNQNLDKVTATEVVITSS